MHIKKAELDDLPDISRIYALSWKVEMAEDTLVDYRWVKEIV